VAVADVYDALTTKRVYKPAFEHEHARAIILEGRGTQFDPDVVDAFIARESDILWVKQALDGDDPQGTLSMPAAVEAVAV
jgi:HD-GYP domain-containing protein (c-di-GMP phosphodiesterase class II)